MVTSSHTATYQPTKRGYKKYLKETFPDFKYDGVNTPFFAMSFLQFVSWVEANNPEIEINRLHNQLEDINKKWYDALKRGEDDTNVHHDAYHLRGNAKRLVHRIEELEQKQTNDHE